jgi:signal transduction histidine kinase
MDLLPTRRSGPPVSAGRLLAKVRWILPLVLAVVAVFFEWSEHIAIEHDAVTPSFIGETVLFGLVGPVAVFVTLAWVARLLNAYVSASSELAEVNEDLEAKILLRTRHLEEATDQLAGANAELARANTALHQLDRLKSEFVSLVSHQLRAPLTNIRGALEIVRDNADGLPSSSRRTLEILTLETDRLSGLIMTILDISRIEAGRLSLSLGPVAVDPLLVRACSATLGPGRGGRWTLVIPAGLPPAWADETMLEEVVRNLLQNAVQHAPDSGPVDVTAAVADGAIRVAVADHGPGVPREEQERIFQSFHRIGADDATVRGYGLGLYFADKLVAAMGGAIRVESPAWPDPAAPGTRFAFTLPIAGDEPPGSDDELEAP